MRLGTVSNYRMRDYYADNPFALLEYLPFILGLILVLCAPGQAQEPRTQIKPADPISAGTHDVTVMGSECSDKPVILPTPLPKLRISLGEYARIIRAAHASVPKAQKIVDTDSFVVETADATEPK
jgi:hypothetical protein